MSTNVPNLKQIGGGHRKNGQKFVDLMWNDPIVNNTGPNTDPWGTPHERGMGSEMASSILTLCVRASRYVSSQDSALACIPNSAFSRDSC